MTSTGGDEKAAVANYFNGVGFERWNKIYGTTDDVNSVRVGPTHALQSRVSPCTRAPPIARSQCHGQYSRKGPAALASSALLHTGLLHINSSLDALGCWRT